MFDLEKEYVDDSPEIVRLNEELDFLLCKIRDSVADAREMFVKKDGVSVNPGFDDIKALLVKHLLTKDDFLDGLLKDFNILERLRIRFDVTVTRLVADKGIFFAEQAKQRMKDLYNVFIERIYMKHIKALTKSEGDILSIWREVWGAGEGFDRKRVSSLQKAIDVSKHAADCPMCLAVLASSMKEREQMCCEVVGEDHDKSKVFVDGVPYVLQ